MNLKLTALQIGDFLTCNLYVCRRELHEELGVILPNDAFELIFIFLQEWLVDQTLVPVVETIPFLFFFQLLA